MYFKKHGTSARVSTNNRVSSKLDSNEQAKIAKLGLEMKLIQNEIETEADKWNEPQNEIVKVTNKKDRLTPTFLKHINFKFVYLRSLS